MDEIDNETKMFLHQMNAMAHGLNKDIVQKSATMQNIPLTKEIYNDHKPRPQQQHIPQQQAPQISPNVQPQVNVQSQDLTPLINRVTSLEKQVTRFVNLIERNVAKNAKEINIRIKLNEKTNNDTKDTE